MKLKVPYYKQEKFYSCGPAALRMVFAYYGKRVSEWEIIEAVRTPNSIGTDNHMLIEAARKFGFRAWAGNNLTIADIKKFVDKGLPPIVNYKEPREGVPHFGVAVGYNDKQLLIHDPDHAPYDKISFRQFLPRWHDHARTKRYHRWAVVISKPKGRGGGEGRGKSRSQSTLKPSPRKGR